MKIKKNSFLILNRLALVTSMICILIFAMIFTTNQNYIAGICVLVGVALPLIVQNLNDSLKEQKGVQANVTWCGVITNSNLTMIEKDLLPILSDMLENIATGGTKSFTDLEIFHKSMEKNLDISAYNEFLDSGLYYNLDNSFQANLFYSREVIKKASIIYSSQAYKMFKFINSSEAIGFEGRVNQTVFTQELIAELKGRLEAIQRALLELNKNIEKYNENTQ